MNPGDGGGRTPARNSAHQICSTTHFQFEDNVSTVYIYTSIVTVCYRMCRYILYTSSILHQRQQSGENPMESVTTSCLKLFSTPRHSSLWQSLAIVHRTLGNNQFLVAEPLNTSSNMSLFAPANAASRQALLSLRCFLRRSWTGL